MASFEAPDAGSSTARSAIPEAPVQGGLIAVSAELEAFWEQMFWSTFDRCPGLSRTAVAELIGAPRSWSRITAHVRVRDGESK